MLELKAKPRTELGKKSASLRRAGFLPAVIYGYGITSQSISIPYKDFEKVYREAGESTLIKLEVDDKAHNVLIYEVKRDPLKGQPIHADFYAVRMDKAIRTSIPLEFQNESPAVKNEGGILVKVVQEVEVEALPQDLPSLFKVDLSLLTNLASRILVKDIPFPKGVKILAGPEEIIALVETPKAEEEVTAPEAAAMPPSEVKTEREVKQELKEKEKKEKEESSQP